MLVGQNKKCYAPCELEVVAFDTQDVITTSNFTGVEDDLGDLLGGNGLM